MSRFEYVDKPHCVCGASLANPSERVRKKTSWGEVYFVRCAACGSWNQSPQISVDSLARWYDSDQYQAAASIGSDEGIYLDYEASERQRQAEAADRYRRDLEGLWAAPGRVLEVGCASGSLLAAAREQGWQVAGIDLSERFAEMGRRLNSLDIAVGDFLDCDYPSAPFDLLVMLGTVSNLQDFAAHLAQVRDSLRQGGRLYFNFPFAGSLVSRFYGERFWMFTPSVSTFFSQAGMRAALEGGGFTEIRFQQDWQHPSVAKVLGQAKLGGGFYRAASRLGLASRGLPFSLPIPGGA